MHLTRPTICSTITDDINAVQDFASTSLLDIVIDVLTIAGMLAVMFTLNWRFTLVALGVTPLVAVFAIRLRAAVKQATRDVRRYQSEIVSVVQEGLGAIRVDRAASACAPCSMRTNGCLEVANTFPIG
jgi:ABC-type multidrug transport system fused ATPase/permease subunit